MSKIKEQDTESLYRLIRGCTEIQEIKLLANLLTLRREREPENWVFRGGGVFANIYWAFLTVSSGTKEQFLEADKAIQVDIAADYANIDDLIAVTSAHQIIVGEKILPTVYPHIDYAGDKDHLMINITPALNSFIHKDTSFMKRESQIGSYRLFRVSNPDEPKFLQQIRLYGNSPEERRHNLWPGDIEDVYVKYNQVLSYLKIIRDDYHDSRYSINRVS